MKNRLVYNPIKSSSGFIVADFLFAFVMVLGIGVFIFGLTFSLATIEVAQYIVWSTARNFAAGNKDEIVARAQAKKKFQNLTSKFPLLTGNGAGGDSWFELTDSDDDLKIGDLSAAGVDTDFENRINSDDKINSFRQPWHGARARINLKLFAGFKIPFLGKVAKNADDFKFPVRAFIIRHPSIIECETFFIRDRYEQGIKLLENGNLGKRSAPTAPIAARAEDNGC